MRKKMNLANEFEPEPREFDEDNTPHCKECGNEMDWQECPDCEEGFSHHDCGEDTCCCKNPKPNVVCDTCNGEDGWWVCRECTIRKKNLKGAKPIN